MSSKIFSINLRGSKLSFKKCAKNCELHDIFLCAFLSFKLPSHSHFATSEAEKFRICSMKSELFENVKGKILCHYGEVETSRNFKLGKL
jgi:hypothetical protein